MGFAIAIIIGFVLIAAIGYAIIYAAAVFLLAIVGTASLIAYLLLYFLFGDEHAGLAMLLAIPVGIGVAALFVKDFKGET